MFFPLCLHTAVVLTIWPAYVCKCVLGDGPGSAVHVYEHGWNLHQLPVRPGPAPSLPGDTEVCGGQAAPGDGKPKTGTKWKGLALGIPSQSEIHGAFFFSPPQTNLDFECSLKVCVQDSRVQSSYVRLLAQSTSGFVSYLQLKAVYEKESDLSQSAFLTRGLTSVFVNEAVGPKNHKHSNFGPSVLKLWMVISSKRFPDLPIQIVVRLWKNLVYV